MKIIGCLATCDDRITIGNVGGLPWGDPLPADMARFRRITTGNPVIMGRTTYQAIPPLVNRHRIVLSRSPQAWPEWHCEAATSVGDALGRAYGYWDQINYGRRVRRLNPVPGQDQVVIVIGGAQVFEQTWGLMDEVHLTVVGCPGDGDTKLTSSFLDEGSDQWKLKSVGCHNADHMNRFDQHFYHYVRRD